ncbi:MAG: hypothetical protein AAGD33_03020 [Actinomycetota bacterium]
MSTSSGALSRRIRGVAAAGALLAVAACGGDGDSLPQSELPAFDGAISVDFNRSLGEISDAVVVVSSLDNDPVQSGAAAVGEVEVGDVAQAIARLCRVERRAEGADAPSAAQLLVDSVRRLVEVDLSLTILGDDEDQCSGLPRVVDAWSVGDAAGEASGAQAVALTLGAFMSGGVQSAVYDGPLADDAEVWYALKAFRNYDDRGGGFRGVALDASTTLSGLVAFAAVDWATLRIVVVNTRAADDSTVLVDLSGAEALREPTIFTYEAGGSSGFVESPSIRGSSLVAMPASSISVIEVVLRDVWRVDSDDRDVDGGEVAAPAPEQADGRAGDGATPTLPPVFDPPVESADDGSALLPLPPVDDDAPIAAPADDTSGTSASAGSGRRRAPTNPAASGGTGGTDSGSGGTSGGSDGGSSPPVAAPPATIAAGGSPTATTEPDSPTTSTEPDTPTATTEPPVITTTTTTTEPPVTATTTTTTEPPPVTDPPVTDPPVTDPPVTDPPVTDPPVTDPPVTDPPVTDPPVTDPPVTDPPVTDPPVTDPPVTDPPVTDPPVTDPPVTDPPVTDPPVTDPPDDPPPITLPPIPLPPPF